jgi:hypothetical protein
MREIGEYIDRKLPQDLINHTTDALTRVVSEVEKL